MLYLKACNSTVFDLTTALCNCVTFLNSIPLFENRVDLDLIKPADQDPNFFFYTMNPY